MIEKISVGFDPYDPEDVSNFVIELALKVNDLVQSHNDLEERIKKLEKKLENTERTLFPKANLN